MTRRRIFSGAVALLTVAFISGTSAAATPGPTRATPIAQARPTGPAKVTVGSSWTLERTGTGCENDAFGKGHRFSSAISDGSGDRGSYTGKKKLTMKWKSGLDSGAIFTGRWQSVTGDYTGRYVLGNQAASATLIPYVTGRCPSSSTMTAHPTSTTVTVGSGATDTATVYGTGGVTPTGTVEFYVCRGDSSPCTTAGTDLASAALTGTGDAAVTRSAPDTPTDIGSYCFLAVYSGDNNYSVSSDGSTVDQCFSVTG